MSGAPAIAIGEWGPAMRALDARQRAFVVAFFEERDATNAARKAGYGDNGKTGIRVTAHRLIHNPKVREAIVEWGRAADLALVPKAVRARAEIVADKGHKDRARVADSILARAGIAEVHEHRVEHVMTVSEQFAELIRLGKRPEEVLANLPADEREKVLDLVKGKDGAYG